MAQKPPLTWFQALEACRRLDARGAQIDRFTLGSEAKIPPSVASGWLSKFADWHYVRRAGAAVPEDGGRWIRVFDLTEWGRKKDRPKRRRNG